MLHPTRLPDCAPAMECILDLQERLLEFSCKHPAFSRDDLSAEFGQELADWLWNNRQRVLDPLKEHDWAIIPEQGKRQVLAQFRHDRLFPQHIDDAGFSFELVVTKQSPGYLHHAKRWLTGYYQQLEDSSFHPQVCHHNNAFTKHDWWLGFEAANPGVNTCAICDASLNAGGKTIEHFFPKSQYPALSVHPENLIPICKTCNNDIKKEKDPLENAAITATFLPYRRFVRSEAHLVFRDDGQGGYAVSLEPINNDPNIQARVHNFDNLFQLSGRWSQAMGEISENAVSRARDYLEAIRDNGNVIDINKISDYVDAVCRKMERGWGKMNYEYVATEWLRWAKTRKTVLLESLATL